MVKAFSITPLHVDYFPITAYLVFYSILMAEYKAVILLEWEEQEVIEEMQVDVCRWDHGARGLITLDHQLLQGSRSNQITATYNQRYWLMENKKYKQVEQTFWGKMHWVRIQTLILEKSTSFSKLTSSSVCFICWTLRSHSTIIYMTQNIINSLWCDCQSVVLLSVCSVIPG